MGFQAWKWQSSAQIWLIAVSYFVLLCAFTYYKGVILGVISPLLGFVAASRVSALKIKDWKCRLRKLSKLLLHMFTYFLIINGPLMSINKYYDNTNTETAVARVNTDYIIKMIDDINLKNFVPRDEFEKIIQDLKSELSIRNSKFEDFPINENDDIDTLKNFALYNESAWLVEYPSPEHVASLYFLNFKLPCFFVDLKSDPTIILQPDNSFVFSYLGFKGTFVIGLSQEIQVKYVSITHMDTEQLSKPKDFSVFVSQNLQRWIYLNSFTYDLFSEQTQHFKIQDHSTRHSDIKFRYVKIEIENNWGDIDYTSLSNIAVYG